MAREEQSHRIREEHAQHATDEIGAVEGPAHSDTAVAAHIGQGKPRETNTQQDGEHREGTGGETTDEEGIEDIADVFEKERPAGTVEGEHLAVATHLARTTGYGGNHEHGKKQGHHHPRGGYRRAIPLHRTLDEEGSGTQHGSHDHHRMQTDDSATEEVAQRESLLPAVIVGIADNETGEDEEEVDGQITVVDECDDRAPSCKGEAFENVVEYHEQGRHASEPVEQGIVGLGIGIRSR